MRFVSDPDALKSVDPSRFARQAVETPLPSRAAASHSVTTKARPAPSSWPITLTDIRERQAQQNNPNADAWRPDEIATARASCAAILKRIDAVVVEQAPIKDGACGTPAPVHLISIGRKPEVVFSPPALVNCDMVEAMHTWLKRDLQPLARKYLGGPIVKIQKMSDYSCRNAYGRAKGRLSEHGRANALDIAGFTTARGDTTMLLADWGMTARDIRRQVAAAKTKAAEQQKARLAAERRGQEFARDKHHPGAEAAAISRNETGSLPPAALGMTSGAPGGGVARASIIDGIPRVTVTVPGGSTEARPASIFEEINRLGGPKPHKSGSTATVIQKAAAPGRAVGEIRKQRFLRGAHAAACGLFGTVLGPEANNAHRNHFHIDLAQRKTGAFCQ